jgi:hypothetical protein
MLRDLLVFAPSAPFLLYIAYRDLRYRLIPAWAFAIPTAVGTAVNAWHVLVQGLTELQKLQLATSLSLAGAFMLLSIYYSRVAGFGDALAVLTAVSMYPFTEGEPASPLLGTAPATVITLASLVALSVCATRRCTRRFPLATAVAVATLAYGAVVLVV